MSALEGTVLMSETTAAAGPLSLPRRLVEWGWQTVVGDAVRTFLEIELLDRSFVLSAQTFVALTPLVLVITQSVTGDKDHSVISAGIIDRFGLSDAAAAVVRTLFAAPNAETGVYWTGLIITIYSSFSLSKRLARAYAAIWEVSPLGPRSMWWRGLAWIGLQLMLFYLAALLRGARDGQGTAVALVLLLALLALWATADVITQNLLLKGQVPFPRLWTAGVITALLRGGVAIWGALYLPDSLSRQALAYGPVGVVFALFTLIFATCVVTLVGPLLASVLTSREPRTWFQADGSRDVSLELGAEADVD